jgi:hypothetical protein
VRPREEFLLLFLALLFILISSGSSSAAAIALPDWVVEPNRAQAPAQVKRITLSIQ